MADYPIALSAINNDTEYLGARGGANKGITIGDAQTSIITGDGAPTGIAAPKGSVYINRTGTTTTTRLYINTDGSTTWTTFTTAA